MLKRLISILLISAFLLVGCAKSTNNTESQNKQTTTDPKTEQSLNNITTPQKTNVDTTTLLLDSEDISYTEFLQSNSFLFFIDTNSKLSVVEDTINTPYILEEQVSETFDYSVGSITSINNDIFFSNLRENNALYKLNYTKKEITKILSGNFQNISSYKNSIIFINKNKGSNLSYLDIKNSKIISISSDKCGKYLINGDYIIYQNLSDNSSLYSIKIDGSEKTKLIPFPTDSFVTYENNILNINGENNALYIYNPIAKTNKKLGNINGTNLKSYNDKIFYIDLSNSNHLCQLEIDDMLESYTSNKFIADTVNDYFPTENGIFIKKSINTNRIFFTEYE